jgi:hypothetical protein
MIECLFNVKYLVLGLTFGLVFQFLSTFLFAASKSEPDVDIQRKDLTQSVTAGDRLTVINPLGDIRGRAGGKDLIEVHAVIQNLLKKTPAPQLNFEKNGQEATLNIQYTKNQTGRQDRVDLVLYIPESITSLPKQRKGKSKSKICTAMFSQDRKRARLRFDPYMETLRPQARMARS